MNLRKSFTRSLNSGCFFYLFEEMSFLKDHLRIFALKKGIENSDVKEENSTETFDNDAKEDNSTETFDYNSKEENCSETVGEFACIQADDKSAEIHAFKKSAYGKNHKKSDKHWFESDYYKNDSTEKSLLTSTKPTNIESKVFTL